MSPLKNAKAHVVRTWPTLRAWTVPQDGPRRYFYDIWQPLTILVLTTFFAGTFFTVKDPYASTSDLFYCNADGNVQMRETGGYKPFWDPDLFFTINVSVKDNLSFTGAKLIDAVWDLGVGRGGQMLAALIAYRMLRRSLTLVMESNTIAIPTVASVCCQQIGILPSWHLLRDVFSTRPSREYAGKRLSLSGRQRLAMQLFACLYVLVFPTLTSVMTGYRTGFTGLFDYHDGTVSEVKPLAEVESPRMSVSDGSRIGLPDSLGYLPAQIPFPGEDEPLRIPVNISHFLLDSKSLGEPAGVLVDCKFSAAHTGKFYNPSSNVLPIDFLTCLGVMVAAPTRAVYMQPNSSAEILTLACVFHDCSCSVRPRVDGRGYLRYSRANMTSNITILGKHNALSGPPLGILFQYDFGSENVSQSESLGSPNITDGMTAGEFWSKGSFDRSENKLYDFQGNVFTMGLFKGSSYNESFIRNTGVCIANEAYSWGFSSLFLLTFCVYTVFFATALIALQTDIYWNSRLDRNHQSYSIFADILMIAEALKSIPEYNLLELLRSPKAIDEKIGGRKHGIRFDMRGLPLARSDEKWALREEKLRDELASHTREETELQRLEPVQQGPGLEGDGLISRVSHEQTPEGSDGDRTMSGAI
jgi:hypothetical protein